MVPNKIKMFQQVDNELFMFNTMIILCGFAIGFDLSCIYNIIFQHFICLHLIIDFCLSYVEWFY